MKIGVVDTMFSRGNMGELSQKYLEKDGRVTVVRRTVPGVKDLPVECKILFEKEKCDIVIACGMVGKEPIDKQCGHEASTAMQSVMLMANKHILEVFVHEDEGKNDEDLASVMKNRVLKHTQNALDMLFDPDSLVNRAGTGQRQGRENAKHFRL